MGGGYNHIYTAGSSKGGTCAIYFGLMIGADEVFSSACQYHVGDYLNTEEHKRILQGMMGRNYTENDVITLNDTLPNMIESKANSSTIINLFFSVKDHTYTEHIIDLINDLKNNGIQFTKTTDDYVEHGENGIYFSHHLKKRFCQ